MAATLVRGAIDARTAAGWLAIIDEHPAWLHRGIDGEVDRAGDSRPASDQGGFDPYSSSLPLSAVSGLDVAAMAGALARSEAGLLARGDLGDALCVDVDRCWVRRQYAPSNTPPRHAPHAWHQDGALCADFVAAVASGRDRADVPLTMMTCWVALTPCGIDAPGLELAMQPLERVLGLDELTDSAIRQRVPASMLWRSAMAPGDALMFDGGVLHHTHVAQTMRTDRTSIEIRFFDPGRIADRLRTDRFVPVP